MPGFEKELKGYVTIFRSREDSKSDFYGNVAVPVRLLNELLRENNTKTIGGEECVSLNLVLYLVDDDYKGPLSIPPVAKGNVYKSDINWKKSERTEKLKRWNPKARF